MAKPISRTSSRKNVCCTSCKNGRRIPKGVIDIQASFNNTIVMVTYTQGPMVSWSSANTCGFRGLRIGTPFAAQTAATNTISIVIDHVCKKRQNKRSRSRTRF